MPVDKRDLLEVLKAELAFIENGGYSHPKRSAWRPQLMFQDSPSCLNFDSTQPPAPCNECVLAQLAPKDQQERKLPCRHISLNQQGQTIDSFYRSGTQEELVVAVTQWLKTTIGRLEREKAQAARA